MYEEEKNDNDEFIKFFFLYMKYYGAHSAQHGERKKNPSNEDELVI